MDYSVDQSMELVAKELPHAQMGTRFWLFETDAWDFAAFAAAGRGSRWRCWKIWLRFQSASGSQVSTGDCFLYSN
jgi:hypothetical protein